MFTLLAVFALLAVFTLLAVAKQKEEEWLSRRRKKKKMPTLAMMVPDYRTQFQRMRPLYHPPGKAHLSFEYC